jgi:hypothetical protein
MLGAIISSCMGVGFNGTASLPGALTVSDVQNYPAPAYAGIAFDAGGNYTTTGNGADPSGVWLVSGDPTKFAVMFQVSSGALDSGNGDTWFPMSDNPVFYCEKTGGSAGASSCAGLLRIRALFGGPDLAVSDIGILAQSDI